jgi:hypothetical protein
MSKAVIHGDTYLAGISEPQIGKRIDLFRRCRRAPR